MASSKHHCYRRGRLTVRTTDSISADVGLARSHSTPRWHPIDGPQKISQLAWTTD